jgi:SsrA-binding protein
MALRQVCYDTEMALITNRKAAFDYELIDRYDAGIVLLGGEVKSVKGGHGSLEGARVLIRGGEAYLVGATIPPYQPNNKGGSHDATRTRKLLLKKGEIERLAATSSTKGLTIVPISVYNKNRKLKLEFAVARKKKKYDKRDILKERTMRQDAVREASDR